MTIQEYLKNNGYNVLSDGTYSHIEDWLEWYKGYVEQFHHYTTYNGMEPVEFDRYRLGMAKRVCEDWASLLLNEKVEITTDQEAFNDKLKDIMAANNFDVRANQLLEQAFALGTGAFVEYLGADGLPVIDYIRAEMIYPLAWDNGDITECAFGSTRVVNGKEVIYLQLHKLNEFGTYDIENRYIEANTGKEMPLPDGVAEVVETKLAIPLFQIFTPNIVNNIDLDSPMGISVYANAIDQLKGCDLVYDSYCNDFALGKKKILVPVTMAKLEMASDGTTKPLFDKNDVLFYAIQSNSDKIEEIDIKIRAQEHDQGMQKQLDLLSFKCGLGNDRFDFTAGGVKTATEVISEKSELYQNLKKHKISIGAALTGMVKAIYTLANNGAEPNIEVIINFDDSIIEDAQTDRSQDRQDVAMGVMSLWEYRSKWYNEDEATAKKMIPEQADMLPDTV